MAEPLGHERQISFFKQDGHDHDGENSSPVVILPGAISLFHLNNALVEWILRQTGSGDGESDDGTMPVPDLEIVTPAIGPGASTTGSVPWVGLSFVRFMRILMSQDTECTVTFYHKSTYADEDREFRAERCANKFLWEGTWGHFDEEESKQIHYRVTNTGNQSATFRITLKSGTMAANAYSRFIEAIIVDGQEYTGTVQLIGGNGVDIVPTGNNFTFNATAPETILVRQWALTPIRPVSFTSSATITNAANINDGSSGTYGEWGSGLQWLRADIGSVVNIGSVRAVFYYPDSRVYNDVKIELSPDGTSWYTVKSSGPVWATENGVVIDIPSGYLARYIRVWSNGSNVNAFNHLMHLEPRVLSDKG